MVKLGRASVCEEAAGKDDATTSEATADLGGRDVDGAIELGASHKLVRLDLANTHISSLEALSSCICLKWLSISGNGLKSMKGIESLSKLSVLNGSRNELTTMNEVIGLIELRALILNDNQIKNPCLLNNLVNLNTLVLSRNPICDLQKVLKKSRSLTKLSLSNCKIKLLGSSLKRCTALKELRLASNQIMNLSKDLKCNQELQILDLGNNLLHNISDIEVLGTLHNLKNLNLRGNPLCNHKSYQKKVSQLVAWVQVLDGHFLKQQKPWKKESLNLKTYIPRKREVFPMKMPSDETSTEHITFEKYMETGDKDKIKQQALDIDRQLPSNLIGGDSEHAPKQSSKRQKTSSDHHKNQTQIDSGIVSITESRKPNHSFTSRHGKHPNLFKHLAEVSIGCGGPSSWIEESDS